MERKEKGGKKGRKEGNSSKKRENILILFPCLIYKYINNINI